MKLSELKQGQWFKDADGDICMLTQIDYDGGEPVYFVFDVATNDWYSYLIETQDIEIELLPTPDYNKLFATIKYFSIKGEFRSADNKMRGNLYCDIGKYIKNDDIENANNLAEIKKIIFEKEIYTTPDLKKFNQILELINKYFIDWDRYCAWNDDRTSVNIIIR